MSDKAMTPAEIEAVNDVYSKYFAAYGDEMQGCCLLIADEISDAIGGDVVAGELTWYGGSCKRTHWWVEKDGVVIDPMGNALLKHEIAPGRNEIHRDRNVFENVLPQYEEWRL